MRQLLSCVRENEGAPVKQPVVAVCARQAVFLRPPAFQAGGHVKIIFFGTLLDMFPLMEE